MSFAFGKYTWMDGEAGNTPVTAEHMNRHENALQKLATESMNETQVQNLINSSISGIVQAPADTTPNDTNDSISAFIDQEASL